MSKNNVIEFHGREAAVDPLTELLRKGAQDLIGQAMKTELAELSAEYSARVRLRQQLCAMVINRNGNCKRAWVQ